MPTVFGKRLREHRKKHKKTVLLLAKACGISHSYVTHIENGKRLPGKKVIPKIATVLNIKTDTLLSWYLEDVSQKLKKELI